MLDKSTERLLRRMDRMGFAGAGEALREIDLLGSQLAMAHAETQEWIEKYNECEKPDERDAEIERLREVESNTTAAMIEWEKRWRSTARENERLRHMLDDVLAEVELPQSIEKRVREALGE